jgi:hypothetical protein
MSRRSTRAIVRPGAYGPTRVAVVSSIAIVVSALCIAAAIVVLTLTSGSAAVSQSASFAGISESARAATLAERVLQDVLRIASSRHKGAGASDVHADLNDAATNLDDSIAKLAASATGPATAQLGALRDSWSPIRKQLALLGDYPGSRSGLDDVVDRTLAFGTQLTEGLAAARAELAASDAARTNEATFWRRLAASVALGALAVLALALAARLSDGARETKRFAGMLERMVGDLAKSSLRLADDRAGHEIILDAAGHGMFVLGRDLRVKPPFAKELAVMFETGEIAGRSVRELLTPFAGERRLREIDAFLETLFRPDIADDDLAIDHPLQELEIARAASDGHAARYLAFSFRRIREDAKIVSVFVSVDDVSDRVRLARELAKSERRRERQQALLLMTTKLSGEQLDGFIIEAQAESRRMTEALRPEDMALATRGHIEILRERLGSLALATERLKKLAHGVGFSYLFEMAGAFERRIAEVRRATYVDGDAFLAIVVMQAELRAEIDELSDFRRRFAKIAS